MSSNPEAASSLRGQLLAWVVGPQLVLFILNAMLSYRVAIDTANEACDRLLLASVRAIADRVSLSQDEIVVDIPYVALELFESNVKERIFYRVAGPNGRTITGYDDLPPPATPLTEKPVFYSANYRGETLYFAALYRRIYVGSSGVPVLVQVGESSESRSELSNRILYDGIVRQGLLIVLAGTLLVLGIRFAMRPVIRMGDSVARRDTSDLSPLDEMAVPSELHPLIAAINSHSQRIRQMIESRLRFLADASHQIRTRLAVLRAQLDYGSRVDNTMAVKGVILEVRQMVVETTRFFEQLLRLAMAETKQQTWQELAPVDLAEIAHEVAFDWVRSAREKNILLEFEGQAGSAVVMGDTILLRELCANVVDNAIRYTPSGGHVTVRVAKEGGVVALEIVDTGPGIPVEEREKVFGRFYRSSGSDVAGSGLGLAIVTEICRLHAASVELADGPESTGLRVRVTMPPMARR